MIFLSRYRASAQEVDGKREKEVLMEGAEGPREGKTAGEVSALSHLRGIPSISTGSGKL